MDTDLNPESHLFPKLDELRLYFYRIPLTSSLPVGSQWIGSRSGLVLEATASMAGKRHIARVEIAPLSGMSVDGERLQGFSRESLAEVRQYLCDSLAGLAGQEITGLLSLSRVCPLPSAAFGLGLLYLKLSPDEAPDFIQARHGWHRRESVPLLCTGPHGDAKDLDARIASLPSDCLRVKLKVGAASLERDLALVYQILALRPTLRLRLDANRSFNLAQAMDFAACLPLDAIDYIEEPCRDPNDNPILYHALGVAFALDETLHEPQYRFEARPGLSALVIKPMLLGSLEKLSGLIAEAQSQGVRCILSSSLETSMGIADLAWLSIWLTPDEAPGLDTLMPFSQDLLVSSGKPHCLGLEALELLAHVSAVAGSAASQSAP